MKNFAYSVTITTEDNRFTYETNDVREAIRAVFECDIEDAHICICNGYTGEVLFHNGEEPYCTDEMGLMMLGFVTEQASAEEEEDEPVEVVEIDPTAVPSDDVLDNLRQLARNGNFLAQALLS